MKVFSYIVFFFYGLGQFIEFELVGRVSLADIIAVLLTPYCLLQVLPVLRTRQALIIMGLFAMYFIGIGMANLINGMPFLFAARGFARSGMVIFHLLFFLHFLRVNPSGLWFLLFGAVVGSPAPMILPSRWVAVRQYSEYSSFVYQIAPIVTSLALFLICLAMRIGRIPAMLVAGGYVIIMAPFASRSATACGLLVFLMLLRFVLTPSKRESSFRFEWRNVFAGAFVGGTLITLAWFSYQIAAPRGWLGEMQQEKYEVQASSKLGATPWGFIITGRMPVVGAIYGIVDHPFFGIGSWNESEASKYMTDAYALTGLWVSSSKLGSQAAGTAGHSVIFGEWLYHGIWAAIFWAYMGYIATRAFFFFYRFRVPLTPYYLYTLTAFFWGLLFSPLSLDLRMDTGFIIATHLILCSSLEEQRRFVMALSKR